VEVILPSVADRGILSGPPASPHADSADAILTRAPLEHRDVHDRYRREASGSVDRVPRTPGAGAPGGPHPPGRRGLASDCPGPGSSAMPFGSSACEMQ